MKEFFLGGPSAVRRTFTLHHNEKREWVKTSLVHAVRKVSFREPQHTSPTPIVMFSGSGEHQHGATISSSLEATADFEAAGRG